MPKLTIIAPFKALPQGSKNAYVMGGRAVLVEGVKGLKKERARLTDYVQRIAYEEKWVRAEQYVPVHLTVVVVFAKPPSIKRERHVVRPDLSKLVRYVEDALVDAGNILYDDSQIDEITAGKDYGNRDQILIIVSY